MLRTSRIQRAPWGSFVTPLSILTSLIATATFLLAPVAALAQENGSVAGKVIGDGELPLATARIPALNLRVDVAADGSFRFDSVRPGEHLIEVRVPTLGGAVQRALVRPGEVTTVEIEVRPGSHFEEVVVTASAEARDSLELATAVSSLSGQELQLRLQSSLGETLAQEPGVSSTFFGPGASRPIIRGLSGDRVRILEGGLGTGDASGVSPDHAVTTDPSQAERIEVLRGPATLLYGSSAIGGAVNVIDERIPTSRATKPIGGTVDLRGGSVDDERMGGIALNGGGGRFAWHADALARDTDDYEIPGFAHLEEEGEAHEGEEEEEEPFGVVPNSDIDTQAGRVGASYFFGDAGFFGVSASGFDTEYGLPGGHHHEEEPVAGEEGEVHEEEEGVPVRIDMEQLRLDLLGEITRPFGVFSGLKVRLGGTDYEHAELEGTEVGTLFRNDFLEGRFELVQRQHGRSSGSLGLQYLDRELEAIGEEAFIPKTDTEGWAVFTFQEIEAGPLRWQLGARFESQDQRPDAAEFSDTTHDGLSGSLGPVWELGESWSLGASVARSVKLPAAEELFSNGAHVANQVFEIGNPDLTEEVAYGLDVSLRKSEGRLTGELTVFGQDFSDFIFQALHRRGD